MTTKELIQRMREADPDEAHPVRLVEGFDAYELEVVGMKQGILYIARDLPDRASGFRRPTARP